MKIKVTSLIISIILVGIWTTCNIKIADEAKEIESNNTTITYSYDYNNNVSEIIYPAGLVTETIQAEEVTIKNDVYNVQFLNTYFGTLEIIFPEPLPGDQNIKITLSEAVSDSNEAWTRKDMNSRLDGFGVSFYSADLFFKQGTTSYRLVLPERPLPILNTINGGWTGGVLPFCCCTLEGYTGPTLGIENFHQIAVHSVFDDNASFFISDNSLLNEIYSFCKDTIKATTYAGVYVDGYRELKPYEADTYINELSHFSVDSEYEMAKSTLRYLVNNHTWPTEWILQTIPIAYQYYMYSGDVDFIKEFFPKLQECLLPELKNEDGLIDSSLKTKSLLEQFNISDMRDIIDWPESERDGFSSSRDNSIDQVIKGLQYKYKGFISRIAGCRYAACLYDITGDSALSGSITVSGPNAVVNAFYYHSLEDLAFLADAIGESDLSKQYNKEAQDFKELYIKYFFSNSTGLVLDAIGSGHSSLHANMFALGFGLIPEGKTQAIISFIKSKGMACSVYGAQFLLEALIKYGEIDYALSLITSTDKKSWYNMIYKTGSKLATEAWDESIKPNMDWNHAWGTAPVNIITRYIVGIRPYEPGCKAIVFQPQFGSLKYCSAQVPVCNGVVEMNYNRNGDKVRIRIVSTVPVCFVEPEGCDGLTITGENSETDKIFNTIPAGEFVIEYSMK